MDLAKIKEEKPKKDESLYKLTEGTVQALEHLIKRQQGYDENDLVDDEKTSKDSDDEKDEESSKGSDNFFSEHGKMLKAFAQAGFIKNYKFEKE